MEILSRFLTSPSVTEVQQMSVQRTHSVSDNYKEDIKWRYLKQHLARLRCTANSENINTNTSYYRVSHDLIISSPPEEMGGPDIFSKKDKHILHRCLIRKNKPSFEPSRCTKVLISVVLCTTLFRCASISWFQVVREWVSDVFRLAHLRVFQSYFNIVQNVLKII